MALQVEYTTDQDFVTKDGYAVVSSVYVSKQNGKGCAKIEIFKDKSARYSGKRPLTSLDIDFDLVPDTGLLVQAYEAAKITPEMAGSIDV